MSMNMTFDTKIGTGYIVQFMKLIYLQKHLSVYIPLHTSAHHITRNFMESVS